MSDLTAANPALLARAVGPDGSSIPSLGILRLLLLEAVERSMPNDPGHPPGWNKDQAEKGLEQFEAVLEITWRGALSDDDVRALARARGLELHSALFSAAAQQLLRELPGLRDRLVTLERAAQACGYLPSSQAGP